jgi:ATP-binding cassette subfamily B (MDR/TAP) protein 1
LEVGSENIMRKLKRDSVASLIKQEIAFFDHQDSSAGGLTSTVSSHPANIGAATGNVSAQMITTCVFCLGSVLLAFIIDWRTAVVCLTPTFPMAFAVGLLNVTWNFPLTCMLAVFQRDG